MKIKSLIINNYKSLVNTIFTPVGCSVLYGANAAGKSNLSEAFDFLSDIYRYGLEIAIIRKGGYENICYRRTKRTKAPMSFQIITEMNASESRLSQFITNTIKEYKIIFKHFFSFKAKSEAIGSDFSVISENIEIIFISQNKEYKYLTMERNKKKFMITTFPESIKNKGFIEKDYLDFIERRSKMFFQKSAKTTETHTLLGDKTREFLEPKQLFVETELTLNLISKSFLFIDEFQKELSNMRMYQLHPGNCRQSGVPTPNAELDVFGGNLPAVIHLLKKRYPEKYIKILDMMKFIIPSIISIEIKYTHQRTLTIEINEKDIHRPWSLEEVSDGTIKILALLSTIYDPRISVLVIEEPENSIHPWILREFIKTCHDTDNMKQIIITTHSPILTDLMKPQEIFIVSKTGYGKTRIKPLTKEDKDIIDLWKSGQTTIFNFLDSGIVQNAVPGGERKCE